MTRRQHRRQKAKNLEKKQEQEFIASHDRPEWADESKEIFNFNQWRLDFLRACNPSYQMKMAS